MSGQEGETGHRPWEVIEVPEQGLEFEFYPWKGPKYGPDSDFGIRILVMGESTYFSEECPEELYIKQRKQIEQGMFAHYGAFAYRQGKWNDGFWTKMAGALLDRAVKAPGDRQLVLDNIAFWNYVDGKPLSSHSKAPRPEDQKLANKKLRLVLDKLRPDLVMLLSTGLWTNLSKGDDDDNDKFNCDPEVRAGSSCTDEIAGHKIDFLRLPHPRGCNSYDVVSCAVRKAIEKLGGHVPDRCKSVVFTRRRVSKQREDFIFQITVGRPYGAWMFDDELRGFSSQPFVHGITEMINELVRCTPEVTKFTLYFSKMCFPDCKAVRLSCLIKRIRRIKSIPV
jgi:hypothetical protein